MTPGVYQQREEGGVNTQPGKTSDALAMVGMCGSADSGCFQLRWCVFSSHNSADKDRRQSFIYFSSMLFFFYVRNRWYSQSIFIAHWFQAFHTKKLPFLAMLSVPEWPLLEHYLAWCQNRLFWIFFNMTQTVLSAELETLSLSFKRDESLVHLTLYNLMMSRWWSDINVLGIIDTTQIAS